MGGAITLTGARTVSGGDTLITARGALNAVAVQDQSSSDFKLHVKTGGNLALVAPKLSAKGDIALTAERGRVYLGAAKDKDYRHSEYSEAGWFKWESGNQGRYDEAVRHAEITAGGQIRIEASNGVVVDYKPDGRLSESVASLSRLRGLVRMRYSECHSR